MDDRHSSTRLQAECRRLETEIKRLKELLEKHNIAFEIAQPARTSTVLPMAEAIAAVQGPELKEQKIRLFRSLFRGREDIYAVRFRAKTGDWGYTPDGETDWNAAISISANGKVKRPKNYFPLTDEAIHQHLIGKKTIGVYPMLTDETCWFLAADFDKESWQDDALAFVETAGKSGVPAYLERSRSGNGGHVWIFFESPISAMMARKLGCFILTQTMDRRHRIKLSSYDRFFPNQDTMPKGGFGNLIALPLQWVPRQDGRSLFVDDNLTPYPDQWKCSSQSKGSPTIKSSGSSTRPRGRVSSWAFEWLNTIPMTTRISPGRFRRQGKLPTS